METSEGRLFNRNIPSTLQETLQRIEDVCFAAINNKGTLLRKVLAGITDRLTNDLSDKLTLDNTYIHSIESSAIIHNQKRHGNEKVEEKRGQIAVCMSDYKLIPEIISQYDTVILSDNKNSQGRDVIIYTKEYVDGTVYFLEEVRENRKSLAFQTMYKKKNAGNSDGLMH